MDEELLFSMQSALITTDSSAGPKDTKSYYSYVHKFIRTPEMQTHLTVCIMWVFFFFPVFFFVCVVLTLLLQLVPKGEKIRKDHYASLENCPPMLLLSQHEHLLLT